VVTVNSRVRPRWALIAVATAAIAVLCPAAAAATPGPVRVGPLGPVSARVQHALASWNRAHPRQRASSWIPTGRTHIVIGVAPATARSAAWRAAIDPALGSDRGRVTFTSTVLTAGSLACSSRLACDAPLRGGVWVPAGDQPMVDTYCTTGVIVKSKTSHRPYVLTAGHCLADYSGLWYERTPKDNKIHSIGKRKSWVYSSAGDFGIMSIDDLAEWKASPYIYVGACTTHCAGHHMSLDASYRVTGTGTGSSVPLTGSPREHRLCKTGATTGTTCGVLAATDVTVNYTDGPSVRGLGEIRGMYACQGDSGSPIFMNGKIFGILDAVHFHGPDRIGPNGGKQKCGYEVFYSGIRGAAKRENVYVPTLG
jgi:hypothetical protein